MIRLIAVLPILISVLAAPGATAQVSATPKTFTGIHRSERGNSRPETVTVTDGKSFIQLTVEEYRIGGYRPAYEKLPTRIIRRLPVRAPAPADLD
ncbi:hypothetical protein XI06_17990 [Bradyrhizobium sp. CCBAU 11434]|uniref:hypothetical protein n=1 Tax=Bradyrhizobium sp. CCBAU 11434 TaxID=1630885 RepID=UPI002306C600|nr:hypothetical protein [Bradyrhizobium sp. CCBAU 11434]MDA9522125.1 hypothetical protein [Bradyrhizobium sp. CCBAU 11434]